MSNDTLIIDLAAVRKARAETTQAAQAARAWSFELTPDGTLRIKDPNGSLVAWFDEESSKRVVEYLQLVMGRITRTRYFEQLQTTAQEVHKAIVQARSVHRVSKKIPPGLREKIEHGRLHHYDAWQLVPSSQRAWWARQRRGCC